MAQERSPNTLEMTVIDGKTYVVGGWPEKFVAEAAWLTQIDRRTTAWDGNKLKLWLENGNAVYTVGDDFDPQAPTATLHKLYGPDPGPVPGQEPPRAERDEQEVRENRKAVEDALGKMTELVAPIRPRLVVPKESLGLDMELSRRAMAYLDHALGGAPDAPLSPLAKALMAAQNPRTTQVFKPPSGPIPGSEGMDEKLLAAHLVSTPGFLDTIYARFKAEQLIRTRSTGDGGYGGPVYLRGDVKLGPGFFSSASNPATSSYDWAHQWIDAADTTTPESRESRWKDYLEDVRGFLSVMREATELLSEPAFHIDGENTGPVFPENIVVMDPVAFTGTARLRNRQNYDDTKTRIYPLRSFFQQAADTMKRLTERAQTLQALIDRGAPSEVSDRADEDEGEGTPLTKNDYISAALDNAGEAMSDLLVEARKRYGGNGEMGGDE